MIVIPWDVPTTCDGCGHCVEFSSLTLSESGSGVRICGRCLDVLRAADVTVANWITHRPVLLLADRTSDLLPCSNCERYTYDDSIAVPKCLYCQHSECCDGILPPGVQCRCEVAA